LNCWDKAKKEKRFKAAPDHFLDRSRDETRMGKVFWKQNRRDEGWSGEKGSAPPEKAPEL